MFGGIAKTVSLAIGKMQLPGMVSSALSRGLTGEVNQRQAFVALLLATAAHVNEKKNFNLELEINDLWVHMGSMRSQQQASGGMGGMVQGLHGVLHSSMFNEGISKAIEGILKPK
ncbi:MAG: hypothetical protein ABIO39_12145 [Caulobacteraceae bacterium]